MNTNKPQALPARLCAHRGMNWTAPENTLPAFDAVLESGGTEIELDIWPAKDGTLIVCHDKTVDRTTDGTGAIADLTGPQLRTLDAGTKFSPDFAGTRLPLFEEILERYGRRALMNLHIKSTVQAPAHSDGMRTRGRQLATRYQERAVILPPLPQASEAVLPEIEQRDVTPYPQDVFEAILKLLDRYGCQGSVYVTGEKDVLLTARALAPDIPRCCLEGHMNYSIVENAVRYGCKRVQFCKGFLSQLMIDTAHAHGLHCNLFWSDDPAEAEAYLAAGIDTILTNDYARMASHMHVVTSF